MKSKAIILLIFLLVIAVSFVTQKSSARQSAKIKDSTGIAPSVSVRERFLGTWEPVSTEYRYTDGTRPPYPDVGRYKSETQNEKQKWQCDGWRYNTKSRARWSCKSCR
jgi:hypothetical protein